MHVKCLQYAEVLHTTNMCEVCTNLKVNEMCTETSKRHEGMVRKVSLPEKEVPT